MRTAPYQPDFYLYEKKNIIVNSVDKKKIIYFKKVYRCGGISFTQYRHTLDFLYMRSGGSGVKKKTPINQM